MVREATSGRQPTKWHGANASNRRLLDGSGAAAYFARVARRMLPIGMTSLRKIRTRDCYYVDKTEHLRRLVEGGDYYFLSRPRRFGKTFLVDTLQKLFEGSEELFRGLAIHDKWDWSVRHPVVRLSFGGRNFVVPDRVRATVERQLAATEKRAGLEPGPVDAAARFQELIEALHERTGQRTVVLVDEYDKPILDALGDRELALANRDFLRDLYGAIKDCDEKLRFVFLTGVSRLAGLFSGLNNLRDITLAPEFSAICGYTDAELDAVFAPELKGLDRDEIRRWYNGYNWRGAEKVYNPFDILLLFRTHEFGNYWFESGTPTFLVETLTRRNLPTPDLDGMIGSKALLSTFDVDRIAIEALLFQTGYLTIAGEEDGGRRYRLDYPNLEVRQSLGEALLGELLPRQAREKAEDPQLRELLEANDFARLETLFRGVFAAIPHQWHMSSPVARYEAHYASVIHCCFLMHGVEPVAEDSGSRGRADMAIRAGGRVYLFEFKVVERGREGTAIAQLREKGYADKYRHLGRSVHLIGVEFSRAERNVVGFDCETA